MSSDSTTESLPEHVLHNVDFPTQNYQQNHPNVRRLHELVESNAEEFHEAGQMSESRTYQGRPMRCKVQIITDICRSVVGPGGRFKKRCSDGTWKIDPRYDLRKRVSGLFSKRKRANATPPLDRLPEDPAPLASLRIPDDNQSSNDSSSKPPESLMSWMEKHVLEEMRWLSERFSSCVSCNEQGGSSPCGTCTVEMLLCGSAVSFLSCNAGRSTSERVAETADVHYQRPVKPELVGGNLKSSCRNETMPKKAMSTDGSSSEDQPSSDQKMDSLTSSDGKLPPASDCDYVAGDEEMVKAPTNMEVTLQQQRSILAQSECTDSSRSIGPKARRIVADIQQNSSSNAQRVEASLEALRNLAITEAEKFTSLLGRPPMFTMVVSAVMKAMESYPDVVKVQHSAVRMFEILSSDTNSHIKGELVSVGAVKKILTTMKLHEDNAYVQKDSCHALAYLAWSHVENKTAIVTSGGIDAVLESMNHFSDNASVQRAGVRALSNLGCCHETNQTKITLAGGVVLVLRAMQNHSADPKVQEYGCQFFANLTKEHTANQKLLADAGGIKSVLASMRSHRDNVEVQTSGFRALDSFVYKNERNRSTIINIGGIETIESALTCQVTSEGIQELGQKILIELTSENQYSVGFDLGEHGQRMSRTPCADEFTCDC